MISVLQPCTQRHNFIEGPSPLTLPPMNNPDDRFPEDDSETLERGEEASVGPSESPKGKDMRKSQPSFRKRGDMFAIICSKVTVYTVLVLAAATVGAVTWYVTKSEEVASFESEVSSISQKGMDHGVVNRARLTLSTRSSDSLQMRSYQLPNTEPTNLFLHWKVSPLTSLPMPGSKASTHGHS